MHVQRACLPACTATRPPLLLNDPQAALPCVLQRQHLLPALLGQPRLAVAQRQQPRQLQNQGRRSAAAVAEPVATAGAEGWVGGWVDKWWWCCCRGAFRGAYIRMYAWWRVRMRQHIRGGGGRQRARRLVDLRLLCCCARGLEVHTQGHA